MSYKEQAMKWNSIRGGLAGIPERFFNWYGSVDDTVLQALKEMAELKFMPPQIKVHTAVNVNEILLGGWWHRNSIPMLVYGTLNMSKGVPKWLVRLEQASPSYYVDELDKRRYHCKFDFTESTAVDAMYLHMHNVFIRTFCAIAVRPIGEEYEDAGTWASMFGVLLSSEVIPDSVFASTDPIEVFEPHTAYCENWSHQGFRATDPTYLRKDMTEYHWRGPTNSFTAQPLYYRSRLAKGSLEANTGEYTLEKSILEKWFADALAGDLSFDPSMSDDAKVLTHRYIPLKDDKRKPVPMSFTRGHLKPLTGDNPPTYWVDPVACTNCGQRLIMYLSKAQSPESGSRPDLTVNCPDCLTDFTPYP
jgi:hypothetical protein